MSVDKLVGQFVARTPDAVLISCDSYAGPPVERHIDVGIREMTAVSVAAGLASQGLRPFVLGLSAFVLTRAFAQIRQDIVLNDLPVVVVGKGSGRALAPMGPTHCMPYDLPLLAALDPLQVFCPATSERLTTALETAHARVHPSYIRVGTLVPVLDAPEQPTFAGQPTPAGEVTLIAAGADLETAYRAAGRSPRPTRVVALDRLLPASPAELHDVRGAVVVLEHEAPGLAEILRSQLPSTTTVVVWRPDDVRDGSAANLESVDDLLRHIDHAVQTELTIKETS
ncbi:hypothetical protein [Streptomyces collinus]|uniref:hypothetical protein n=1 Tax=Streptomyces collinus TaxID=42684 RepID=UPI002942EC36|nr:hypothetical protein [Streptomyces collinus]